MGDDQGGLDLKWLPRKARRHVRSLRDLVSIHLSDQKQSDAGINRYDCRSEDHEKEKRKRHHGDIKYVLAGEPLNDKQVHADRRRDLGHFDHENEKYSKPYRVDPERL